MTLPTFPKLRFIGRQRLYTYLTPEEIEGSGGAEKIRLDLEQFIIPLHFFNAAEENYLFEYYAGFHPNIMTRVKETRGDINNKVVLNYAKAFSRDIVSYFLGKPIQYVQRDQKFREAAQTISNTLDAESKNLVDYNIAMNMSICGVGYRGVFPEATAKNGSHASVVSLDPRFTFVVYSPDKTVGALYCGTFYTTPPAPLAQETKTVYKIYTKTKEYIFEAPGFMGLASVEGLNLVSSKDTNLGGNLPIIDYPNTYMMMGDWESELALMDSLDTMTSDSVNDIEQFVNSILLLQGFELDEATLTSLEQNKILNIPDVPVGVEVVVKYLAEQLDAEGAKELRQFLESTLRSIVGVPDRNNKAMRAETGDAMFLGGGWQDLDLVAATKEKFFIDSDRKMLATLIYILQTFGEVDKDVTAPDIEVKFSRTKQVNLQAKAQAYATMVGAAAPIAPADALEFADLTNNVTDVIERSEKFAEEKMERQREMFQYQTSVGGQFHRKDNFSETNAFRNSVDGQ